MKRLRIPKLQGPPFHSSVRALSPPIVFRLGDKTIEKI